MGQSLRDDRRRVRQETVELWEMEREETRASRSTPSRQERRSQQRRSSQWIGETRQAGEQRQRRVSQQSGQPRQAREAGQIRRPQQETRSHQQRRVPQQSGRSRQARGSGQAEQTRQVEQSRQIGQTRQIREPGRGRKSRQTEYSQQVKGTRRAGRSEYARAASYRQEKELQFVLPVTDRQSGSPRPVQSMKRRRARRRKILLSRAVVFLFVVLCLVLIYQTTGAVYRFIHRDVIGEVPQKEEEVKSTLSDKVKGKGITPPEIVEDYLEINDYSRPGTELKTVKSVFVHYTANPRTSARQNRSYFANLAETHEREASAHLIIGYEGELVQCIPLDEQAYGVKGRNADSISIECCYLAEDGSFTPETYETLLHTLAWLLEKYDLTTEDILRHYDCGGKLCPLYYVEHEDAWEALLADVAAYEAPTE